MPPLTREPADAWTSGRASVTPRSVASVNPPASVENPSARKVILAVSPATETGRPFMPAVVIISSGTYLYWAVSAAGALYH